MPDIGTGHFIIKKVDVLKVNKKRSFADIIEKDRLLLKIKAVVTLTNLMSTCILSETEI